MNIKAEKKLINRKITSDNITGSYSHIELILKKYSHKTFNADQVIVSINWKTLIQQPYIHIQKKSRCCGKCIAHQSAKQLVITRIIIVPLDVQGNKLIISHSLGLFNNNFWITNLEVPFPNFSPRLRCRKANERL